MSISDMLLNRGIEDGSFGGWPGSTGVGDADFRNSKNDERHSNQCHHAREEYSVNHENAGWRLFIDGCGIWVGVLFCICPISGGVESLGTGLGICHKLREFLMSLRRIDGHFLF